MNLYSVSFAERTGQYYVVAKNVENIAEVATHVVGDHGKPPTVEGVTLIAGQLLSDYPTLLVPEGVK